MTLRKLWAFHMFFMFTPGKKHFPMTKGYPRELWECPHVHPEVVLPPADRFQDLGKAVQLSLKVVTLLVILATFVCTYIFNTCP